MSPEEWREYMRNPNFKYGKPLQYNGPWLPLPNIHPALYIAGMISAAFVIVIGLRYLFGG